MPVLCVSCSDCDVLVGLSLSSFAAAIIIPFFWVQTYTYILIVPVGFQAFHRMFLAFLGMSKEFKRTARLVVARAAGCRSATVFFVWCCCCPDRVPPPTMLVAMRAETLGS